MQQIQIIGNLGADAKIVDYNNSRFVSFVVACTEKIKRSGDDNEVTTWYSVTYNKPDAGVVQFLKKGVRVFVQGLPSYSLYDSATMRCKMIDVKIFADRIYLCSDKKAEDSAENKESDAPPF